MKNIVIFGGAFDPIHNGHLNMAINASKTLDADVYFVPARISVWKKESVSVEHKIEMLKLAIATCKEKSRFKISRIEADSKADINYTIDTVRQFKHKFINDNLYLLIGTDQVNDFYKWKDAELIAKLCTVVFFDRPDIKLDNDKVHRFNMKKIEGNGVIASSTDIRNMVSFATPQAVINYIIDNDLYFMTKIKPYLNPDRYKHSASVAKLAYEIAIFNNVSNPDDYLIAGLLHDIGKCVNFDAQLQIMNEYFPTYISLNPKIYHQFVGKYLAQKDFGVEKEYILNAIMYHTTGKSDMTDIEKVVYCADKIDPTRGFDSASLIKAIKVNISKGFITILKDNKEYFRKNNVDFKNSLSESCMNFYLK